MKRQAKPRKAKKEEARNYLEELDEILARCFDAKNVAKEILEQKDNVIVEAAEKVMEKRRAMKEMLQPCFVNVQMPSTPKNYFKMHLKHRMEPRVLDFSSEGQQQVEEGQELVFEEPNTSQHENKDDLADIDVVEVAHEHDEVVIVNDLQYHMHAETHITQASALPPHLAPARQTPVPSPRTLVNSPVVPRQMSPQLNVIPGTPDVVEGNTGRPVLVPRKGTKLANSKQKVTQAELKRRQELATQKRAELQKEKTERKKLDNEQRKRRVDQNRAKKQQEEASKKEEHKAKHDMIRQFQDAQRQTPGSPMTPRHLPLKKSKQQQTPSKPVQRLSRPKPLVIEPEPIEVDHHEVEDIVEEVIEEFNEDMDLVDVSITEKENAPKTPSSHRLNQSAYEMTPDKVPVPSSANDYNVNDLSSNDETDNEDEPKKKVPSWAEKEALRVHIATLRQRLTQQQINDHFGKVRAPNVHNIFGVPVNKTYRKLDETTLWESPIGNPRPAPLAPLVIKAANRRPHLGKT